MASLTLLVMAAGIGSRYGGLKQIDPVGPNGEIVIDYSVYDALRAGFDKVVFVIRREIEDAFREKVGRTVESRVETAYVFQELDSLPAGFHLPAREDQALGHGTCHPVRQGQRSRRRSRPSTRTISTAGRRSRRWPRICGSAADIRRDLRLCHGRLRPREHPLRARARDPGRLRGRRTDRCLVDVRERREDPALPRRRQVRRRRAGIGSRSRPGASSR